MQDTTNLNVLLNPQPAKSSTSLRSNYFSRKTYNLNYKNSGSFNNVLDKISTPTERSTPTDNFGATNRTSNDYSRQTSRANERSMSKQSASTKNDAAPDDVEHIDDVEEDIDEKPSAKSAPVDAPVMFTMSTETLLAVRETPTVEEPVMMTVLPQQSNADNQSMLNMLAGNTWRAVNVEPEAIPTGEVITPTATVLEPEAVQPLNVEAQPIDPRGVQPTEIQSLNAAPTDRNELGALNVLDTSTAPIEVDTIIETPTIEQPTIDPRGVQSTEAQPSSPIVEQSTAQPIVEQTDASSQTQVISNDATLSNVVDTAKNSQPKLVTNDVTSTEPALDEAAPLEPTALDQPTREVPTAARPMMNQAAEQAPIAVERPITPIENVPTLEAQQPSTTQPTAPTVEQPTLNQPTIEQSTVNQPTIEQPTIEQPTIDQPTIEQPTINQLTLNQPTINQTSIEQPTIDQAAINQPQSTAQPSQTQQVFDEAISNPRGAEQIDQPTTITDRAIETQTTEANAQPVHRRYHGQAAQQAVSEESAWTNRPTPLYQLNQQQASNVTTQNNSGAAPQSTLAPTDGAAQNISATATPIEVNGTPTAPSLNPIIDQSTATVNQPTLNQPTVEQPIINQPTATINQTQSSAQSTAAPFVAAPQNNLTAAPINQPQSFAQPTAAPSVAAPQNNSTAAPFNPVDQNGSPTAPINPIVNQSTATVNQPQSSAQQAAPFNPTDQNGSPTAPINPIVNQPTATVNQPQSIAQPTAAPIIDQQTSAPINPIVNQPTATVNQTTINQPQTSAQQAAPIIDQQTSAPINPIVNQPTATVNQTTINQPQSSAQPIAAPIIDQQTNAPINPIANQPAVDQPTATVAQSTANQTTAQSTAPAHNQTTAFAVNISASTPLPTAAPAQNLPPAAQSTSNAPDASNVSSNVSSTAPRGELPIDTSNPQLNQQFNQQSGQQSAQQQFNQQFQQAAQQAVNTQAQAQMSAPIVEGQTAAQLPGESFAQNLNNALGGNTVNTPQPTTQAQPSTPNTAFAQQLRDDFNVTGQIVESARLFRNALSGTNEMVLQLRPEHLGELTVRVSVTAEGTVNASFHSDNAAVRAIIENSLVSLKQELANQGLKVDNVEVYAGLADGGSLMNGKGRQAWQQNRQNAQRVGRVRGSRNSEGGAQAGAKPAAQSVDIAQPVENVATDGGVDYKV